MKKIIVLTMLLILATASFSQQTTPASVLTRQDYLQKSKHQKTAAFLLLGGGFVLTTTAAIIITVKATEDFVNFWSWLFTQHSDAQNSYTAETILFLVGTAAMITSIPLFIASAKNKRTGMSLSFKNETSPQLHNSSLVYRAVPSLSLKLKL